jgi:hypothetical protein
LSGSMPTSRNVVPILGVIGAFAISSSVGMGASKRSVPIGRTWWRIMESAWPGHENSQLSNKQQVTDKHSPACCITKERNEADW